MHQTQNAVIPQCIAPSHGGNKNNRNTNPDKVFKKFCKLFRWYSYRGNQDNRATEPNKIIKKFNNLSSWVKNVMSSRQLKFLKRIFDELAPNPTCTSGKSPVTLTILSPIFIPHIPHTFEDSTHDQNQANSFQNKTSTQQNHNLSTNNTRNNLDYQ